MLISKQDLQSNFCEILPCSETTCASTICTLWTDSLSCSTRRCDWNHWMHHQNGRNFSRRLACVNSFCDWTSYPILLQSRVKFRCGIVRATILVYDFTEPSAVSSFWPNFGARSSAGRTCLRYLMDSYKSSRSHIPENSVLFCVKEILLLHDGLLVSNYFRTIVKFWVPFVLCNKTVSRWYLNFNEMCVW